MAQPISSGKMAPNNGIQSNVLYKLILFAVLMAVVPIATYFGTLNYFFEGKVATTYSAISAVVAANIVLIGYVVVAFREDAAERTPSVPGRKKDQ